MDIEFKDFFRKYLISIGEEPDREGLQDTPQRVEDAYKFLFKGYNESVEEIINGALFKSEASEMIIVKNIELYSMCEHHILPFFGKCHIGYVPDEKFIGLSKIARIVDVFARRLQIQERLTKEVGESIMKYTKAKGVGVVIEAQHLCMMMRGVEKQNSVMVTSYMNGVFRKDPRTRAEFMSLIDK